MNGFVSDFYDCQTAFIYSNYVSVTAHYKTNGSILTLIEDQSENYKVSCYDRFVVHSNGSKASIKYRAIFKEYDKQEEEEVERDIEVTYDAVIEKGDVFEMRNNTFL